MKLLNLAKRLFLLPIGGLLVVHIGGCGGGASSKNTGTFVDAPVDGINYSTTSGLTGVTQNGGQFQFQSGDQVTFTIGGSTGLVLGTATADTVTTPMGFASSATAPQIAAAATVLQALNDGTVAGRITIPPGVNAFFSNPVNSAVVSFIGSKFSNTTDLQASIGAVLPTIMTAANYPAVADLPTLQAAASMITPDQALFNMQINLNILKSGQNFCTNVAADGGYWMGPVTELVDTSHSSGSCTQDPNGLERVLTFSSDCSVFEQAFSDANLTSGGLSAQGIISSNGATQAIYSGKYPDSSGTGNNKYTMNWSSGAGVAGATGSTVTITGTFERITSNARCVGTTTGTFTKSTPQLSKSNAGGIPI